AAKQNRYSHAIYHGRRTRICSPTVRLSRAFLSRSFSHSHPLTKPLDESHILATQWQAHTCTTNSRCLPDHPYRVLATSRAIPGVIGFPQLPTKGVCYEHSKHEHLGNRIR